MPEISAIAAKIRLAIFDVDGVLSDGTLFYTDSGMHLKGFHVHDGVGIKMLQSAGVEVAIITSHNTEVVAIRANDLGIEHLYQGYHNKIPAFEDLLSKLNVTEDQVCYVGDDLPDLPIISRVGLGVTVANAQPFIQQHAKWQTQKSGGHGAVREVCEMILQAQGKLQQAQEKYMQ